VSVDDHSTDRTVEVVRELGLPVSSQRRHDDPGFTERRADSRSPRAV